MPDSGFIWGFALAILIIILVLLVSGRFAL